MSETQPYPGALPADAGPAVAIVRALTGAGHRALLAGGCVRDLLLGSAPQDYDVATDAPPERVVALFPKTRLVGAQFGVVLVKKRGHWIEVATFRTDDVYLDGRRPVSVQLSDARHDAQRRDFTVNGMFLDPLAREVIDYVGGQPDLEARLIRAIGEPAARFAEDHLRLVRAVRFAARLGFEIEPATLAAIRLHAPRLERVAAERVREELEKMLKHPARQRVWRLLGETGLRPYLWTGATWTEAEISAIDRYLGRLPAATPFELVFAILLLQRGPEEIERIARAITLSNEERETVLWLVTYQADLDEPERPSLAEMKRLMAHPAFALLFLLAQARYEDLANFADRRAALANRLAAISPESVRPAPLVTGDDLLARAVPAGPIYRELLDELYTRQLNEELNSRADALVLLERWLKERLPPATK